MATSLDDFRESTISIPMDVPNPFEFWKHAVLQVGRGRSTKPDMKKYFKLAGFPCHDEYPQFLGLDALLRALLLRNSCKVVDEVDQFIVTSGE